MKCTKLEKQSSTNQQEDQEVGQKNTMCEKSMS